VIELENTVRVNFMLSDVLSF